MLRFPCLIILLLLAPRVAGAATLVTWTSEGSVTYSEFFDLLDTGQVPPPGTAYQLTVSFDPGAVRATTSAPPGSDCVTVPVAGSLTLSGAAYGFSGQAFTNAQLPGTSCSPESGFTQFFAGLAVPAENVWPAFSRIPLLIEASFRDFVNQDGFPAVPVAPGLFIQIREQQSLGGSAVLVHGFGDLEAASPEQPAPVPEPGTMTLVGLGLAAAIRHARKTRRA